MNLSKMTKVQLIEKIKHMQCELEYSYTDDQYQENYDRGVEHGKELSTRYISNSELSDYDNVLRFG